MKSKNNLGFLYKKLNINRTALAYWISLEEFSNKIEEQMNRGISIDEHVVLRIMQEIYLKYEELRKNTFVKPDFNYYLARRGIESLWLSITGHKDGWKPT